MTLNPILFLIIGFVMASFTWPENSTYMTKLIFIACNTFAAFCGHLAANYIIVLNIL